MAGTAQRDDELIVRVEDLRVEFHSEAGVARAVDGVSFEIGRGRVLGLVGESGCGKSVTAYSLLRLVQPPGRLAGGRITLFPRGEAPVDVTALDDHADLLYRIRGGVVGMIFQEPMTALSPVHTIGAQLEEAVRLHPPAVPAAPADLALAMLDRVGIPSPALRLRQYPHQLSGGMRQRVVIAMALIAGPELVIADEPTTALDVTLQAQVLRLLGALQRERGTAVLLITHDLGVVAQAADDVAVMYLGRIVERGPVREVLKDPSHPYTMALLASRPGAAAPGARLPSIPGMVPPILCPPPGCAFHPRCVQRLAGICDQGAAPALRRPPGPGGDPAAPGRAVACFWREREHDAG